MNETVDRPGAVRPAVPEGRELLLLGGGHSHVEVLRRFGMMPPPARARVTLVGNAVLTPYSGMLPGHLAGLYSRAECHLDLRRIAAAAGIRYIEAKGTAIDLAARRLHLAGRPPLPFDILSINLGITPSPLPGSDAHALAVKPVDAFLRAWAALEARAKAEPARPFTVAVIGAGAGGTELAISLAARLAAEGAGHVRFTLVSRSAEPLRQHAPAVRRRMAAAIARAGIRFLGGREAVAVERGAVLLADGERIACDSAILTTTATPAPLLREAGLATDAAGFVSVAADLRSVSHPFVFASGDCAHFAERALPKSGVYAVRQGPMLAMNLRAVLAGRPTAPYRPQPRTLALMGSGPGRAVASYGSLAAEGRAVFRLKRAIDTRWMARYQALRPGMMGRGAKDAQATTMEAGAAAAMRCLGCAAKVAGPVLSRVLARLREEGLLPPVPDAPVALAAPDDAAVFLPPSGRAWVQTLDHFPALTDDPYRAGRIAALHGLNDIFAMGAAAHSALALAVLPHLPEPQAEADLYQMLRGMAEELARAGAVLAGGHSGEGEQLACGLALNGVADAAPGGLWRKGDLVPGDALVLTKPLGTGVLFAAFNAGAAEGDGESISAALGAMLQSNGPSVPVLRAHGARGATDITGFGLAGHLLEMLSASGADAALDLAALPALPGALAALAAGHASTAAPANAAAAEALAGAAPDALRALLFDPQTAGPLLAGVPAERAEACVAALRAAGLAEARAIGRVLSRADGAHAPTIRLEAVPV
ncbi:MAG: selenide, water dikinase SelD [Alphaproteobacteria bacterium]|nr:selenide, water dikinase SelD [Alphaproteobacteria bacterium]